MRKDTPPHEKEYDDINDEQLEVYEIDDIDEVEDLYLDEEASNDVGIEDEAEHAEDDENFTEISRNTYSNHKGSVFCCAFCPQGQIAASGGEDDMAYVWDIESNSTLFECTGHKDSVTCLSFSHDGSFLATGDMSGFVQVWKISTKKSVWNFETDDINWMTWHTSSNILLAGTTTGDVWMWLIPRGNTKSLYHAGSSAECGAITRDGKRLCVGYRDGSVRILNLKSGQALHTLKCNSSVTSICTHQDNILTIVGLTDATAIINSSSGKEICSLKSDLSESSNSGSQAEESYDSTVEAVSFCPQVANFAVTATLSGIITIWDISSQTARHHIVQGCGSSCIVWHPKEPHFFTGGLDGVLRVYDVRSAEQLFKFRCHDQSILSCDINKEGTRIMTSSDDGTLKVLNIADLFS